MDLRAGHVAEERGDVGEEAWLADDGLDVLDGLGRQIGLGGFSWFRGDQGHRDRLAT